MIRSHGLAIPDGGQYVEDPPDGPPTNVTEFFVDEMTGEIGVQWASGDPTAWTQIGYNSGGEPTSVINSFAPEILSYETGTTDTDGWYVRHTKGGVKSAWVKAVPA